MSLKRMRLTASHHLILQVVATRHVTKHNKPSIQQQHVHVTWHVASLHAADLVIHIGDHIYGGNVGSSPNLLEKHAAPLQSAISQLTSSAYSHNQLKMMAMAMHGRVGVALRSCLPLLASLLLLILLPSSSSSINIIRKNDEVSMGTTILAVRYNGGVVAGADTRTSVSGYVSNRYAAKLTFVLVRAVDSFVVTTP